jgi:ATP-binding cassette subfamily A (ABC1) protein 3
VSDVNSFMDLKDEDIAEEEKRVAEAQPDTMTVRLSNVKKTYGKQVAVDNLSFGLEYGECFALLGVSGAGKTTTFRCLTGEEIPTSGEVQISGYDVTTEAGFDKARRLIGYCPQFDAIFEGMTVREHLDFYAAVKGVIRELR